MSVPATVGALDDGNIAVAAVSDFRASGCFEKYKEQFGDKATKTSAFEIVKQYQDKADGLILIFENHEKRLCEVFEDKQYVPFSDLLSFKEGKYDNSTYDSELIIKRCKNHSVYDECFGKFTTDSDVIDVIKSYQEMFDAWIPKLISHEKRIQDHELIRFGKIHGDNLKSEFLK